MKVTTDQVMPGGGNYGKNLSKNLIRLFKALVYPKFSCQKQEQR